ncbi:MAG: 30S ribosomal protein S6 [Candidatus Pacebacteria bacterium]|nr:30S ribosomal protein S6 [Candidatus Paceibacterota bacterium]
MIAFSQMSNESKTYEISYLLSPLVPEDKVPEEVAVLREAIENNGGLLVSEDMPKTQRLSYPIKKNQNAYFGWFRFTADGTVEKIKSLFEKNDKILRSLATEAGKENLPQYVSRKGADAAKKEDTAEVKKEKEEIKPEQIDEKLEQILKEQGV